MSLELKLFIPLIILLAAAVGAYFLKVKPIKKIKLNKVVSILLLVVIAASFMAVFVPTTVKLLTPFYFNTEPSIFDSGDTYSVMWATSRAASAKVEVEYANGEVKSFSDAVDGVGVFNSRIHRVDIEKAALEAEGAKYRVSSRKTVNTSGYAYKLGREITSDYYSPRLLPNEGGEDVSFFAISDVQGGEKYAKAALEKQDASYDFVLMLGDYSNDYNSEDDFIEPLLGLSALASKSVLPCVYVTGNHELKGTISKEVNKLFKTPSEDNQRYFTYSYGSLFMTALNFTDDHSDDMPRYSGVSECDAYKDAEYNWLKQTVMEEKEYLNYKYNIGVSHIPLLSTENGQPIYTELRYCGECDKAHGYKLAEFREALSQMNIDVLVSAHTHSPKVVTHPDCSFKNIQTGAVSRKAYVFSTGYTCNHISFSGNKCTNTLYNHKGEKQTTEFEISVNEI